MSMNQSAFEAGRRDRAASNETIPKGKKVTVRAELIEVDARKLRFKVEAHDEDKKVGDGTHRRAIIAIQRQG
jgi:predicted thioesterase